MSNHEEKEDKSESNLSKSEMKKALKLISQYEISEYMLQSTIMDKIKNLKSFGPPIPRIPLPKVGPDQEIITFIRDGFTTVTATQLSQARQIPGHPLSYVVPKEKIEIDDIGKEIRYVETKEDRTLYEFRKYFMRIWLIDTILKKWR